MNGMDSMNNMSNMSNMSGMNNNKTNTMNELVMIHQFEQMVKQIVDEYFNENRSKFGNNNNLRSQFKNARRGIGSRN